MWYVYTVIVLLRTVRALASPLCVCECVYVLHTYIVYIRTYVHVRICIRKIITYTYVNQNYITFIICNIEPHIQ